MTTQFNLKRLTQQWLPLSIGAFLLLASCQEASDDIVSVEHQNLLMEFNTHLHSRISSPWAAPNPLVNDFQATEYLTTSQGSYQDFSLTDQNQEAVRNAALGTGQRTVLQGESEDDTLPSLTKILAVEQYDDFPDLLILQVQYVNQSQESLNITKWVNHAYTLNGQADEAQQPAFWSFQSGSYENRPDWVLPLTPDFTQKNYMGMNASDYGGGTPVTDVWRPDVGVAVGHIAPVPKLVSLTRNHGCNGSTGYCRSTPRRTSVTSSSGYIDDH